MLKKNARYNYLVCIYLSGIVFFTLFRLAETAVYCSMAETPADFGGQYPQALLMGFRFDTVVSCYLLAVPMVLLIAGQMARIGKAWFYAMVHYVTMVLYTVAFFACAADIPYFCYFFNRLDAVALSWMDNFGTSMGMIFSEPRYWLYLVVFVAVATGWWLSGRIIYRRVLTPYVNERISWGWAAGLTVVLLALWFVGQRGTLTGGRPVRVSTAFFSNNPFINQIGLNPVFTFIKSLEENAKEENREIALTDRATADSVIAEQRALPVDSALATLGLQLERGTNVVVVIMESMSAEKTALGHGASLTPCLDSLMAASHTFTQAWSAGIHTYNGIYSTLYGQPAILARHSMRRTPLPRVYGLPQALGSAGYHTAFFVAHSADFDNLQGFLSYNGIEQVVDKKDYPPSEYVNTWGPPDHVLFDHVLEHCDSMAAKGPFMATLMTISDHGPYVVPQGTDFRPRNKEMERQVVEYADWSIGRFMRMAAQRTWFEKTLFVFVADHGAAIDKVYDMSLAYNHVPLIFHAPGRIAAARDDRPVLQLDAAATILGLLGLEGGDRTLGIDLMRQSRPYAYFSADDKIGVVDGEWFYLYRVKQQNGSLYRYREGATDDLAGHEETRVEDMRRYAFGMIQASQEMLKIKNEK